MSSSHPPKFRVAGRFDPGRLLARVLCVIFALLGALPLAAGYIARSDTAEAWVSRETARVLHDLLGIEARYQIRISLLPLEVALEDVRVESTDGGEPAIRVARVAITPRIFSLIAGRLDIGDIEIERAEHRLIIEEGVLTNLSIRLPETPEGSMEHAPFRSLSATDTRFDVLLDGVHVETGPIDLDVFTEGPDTVEVALRMGESRIAYSEDTFASTRSDGLPGPTY
jgi:translocation and assembly module TamB